MSDSDRLDLIESRLTALERRLCEQTTPEEQPVDWQRAATATPCPSCNCGGYKYNRHGAFICVTCNGTGVVYKETVSDE